MMRKALACYTARMRTQAGLTLTEMLVTLLIMTLASTLLATGIPVAIDTYHKTVNSANAQMALSTTLTKLRSELGTSSDVRVVTVPDSSEKVVYYLSEDGYWASISNSDEYRGLEKKYYLGEPTDVSKGEPTDVSKVSVSGIGAEVGDMTYPLVSEATLQGTQALSVKYSDLRFDGSSYDKLVLSVSVTDNNGNELASVKDYRVLLRFN